MSKYKKAKSGEWVPQKKHMLWKCCDCGLIHNVYFRIGKEGYLEVKMTRK